MDPDPGGPKHIRIRIRNTGPNYYVGPALDVGVTPVRRVPVKDDGMPETPELETINLRALLRFAELSSLFSGNIYS
jgi:hypothetical protein